jgi:hypothetical protein
MEEKRESVFGRGMGRGQGRGRGKFGGNANAPMMAYKTVYGKYPEEPMRGRTDYPKKEWKGLWVDKNLKNEWLEKLNSIGVEIKSTEEGKDKMRVAAVTFRLPEEKDDLYKEVEKQLKKEKDLKVSSDIGVEGRPRICVAKDIWVGKEGWEEWWSSLPKKIERAFNRAIK